MVSVQQGYKQFIQKLTLIKNKIAPQKTKDTPGSKVLLKYIFKELLYYFVICFLFLFVIFFANQILLIGEQLLSKRAPFKDVFLIMVYSIPALIAQTTPFATLVGFLMCLGRMMSDNEILVIRASGFGFRYILVPVLLLGFIISLASFFINDYLMPLSRIKYNKLFLDITRSNPTIVLEPNSVKMIGNTTVVIGDVDNDVVSDIILFNPEGNGEETIIVAKESQLKDSKDAGVLLQLNMSEPVMFTKKRSPNNYDVMSSEKILMNIFDTVFSSSTGSSPSEMTSSDLKKSIKELIEVSGKDDYQVNQWNMEYYKKFSIPFASLFFSILAFSVAFLFGKNNGLTMGLFVGIIICVLYWAMQINGQMLVVYNQMNAFWCIWIPNILVGGVGVILGLFLLKK
ncbi:MAG: LptF/LptG family permease [Treponema sp.]|nr:LptF/LptG family permease [Treponema sp.]